MTRQAELIQLIREMRTASSLLREATDTLHEEIAVTAAMRSVLELLEEAGPQTVPNMARARHVTRQHIQQLVDALGEASLVSLRDNPAHRRSALVALTDQGRSIFAAMRRREAQALKLVLGSLGAADLAGARNVLAALSGALARLDAHAIGRADTQLVPAE